MMVGIIDDGPDVVEEARSPQQLALPVIQPMHRAQIIEHAQRQKGDVMAVMIIPPEDASQIEDAEVTQIGEKRSWEMGEIMLEEKTLAQARATDGHLIEAALLQKQLVGDGRGGNDVRPIDPQPANPPSLFQRIAPELIRHRIDIAGRQPVAVDG